MKKESIQFLTLAILISLSIENAQANKPTQELPPKPTTVKTPPAVKPAPPLPSQPAPSTRPGETLAINQPNTIQNRPTSVSGLYLDSHNKITTQAESSITIPNSNTQKVKPSENIAQIRLQTPAGETIPQPTYPAPARPSGPPGIPTPQQHSALKTPEQIAAQTTKPASKNNSVLTWFKNLLSSSNTTSKPNQTPAAANQPAPAPAKTSSTWWPSFMNRSPQKPSPTTTQPATTTAQTSSSWLPNFMHRSQKPSSAAGIQNTKNSTGSTNTGDTPEMIRDSKNLL